MFRIIFPSKVVILDVRVPCTPVARLNNHRACVNGIAWAPHSSCHICTAGKDGLYVFLSSFIWAFKKLLQYAIIFKYVNIGLQSLHSCI